MKKKGFTLIELLAVIVILAVIALIATPLIMNVIEDARDGALKNSARYLLKTAETEYALELMNNPSPTIDFNALEYKGERMDAIAGSFDENGKASIAVYKGNKCVYQRFEDEDVILEKGLTKEKCLAKVGATVLTIGQITDELLANSTSNNYNYMNGTYLSGIQTNNNVWLSGQLFKIMGKDENGNIRLVEEGSVTSIPYDDTSNQFETSHVYDWLNDYYYDHLDEELKDSLQMTSYCTDATDDENAARETCTNVGSAKVALLSLDEYNLAIPKQMECMTFITIMAQMTNMDIDELLAMIEEVGMTCLEYAEANGCEVDYESEMVSFPVDWPYERLSYLYYYYDDYFNYSNSWSYTLTPSIDTTQSWIDLSVFTTLQTYDVVNLSYGAFGVRPVITVSPDVVLSDGDGTYENPYREIENHENEKLYDVVTSGEYVQFNDHLYRVVEKNASGTKISYDGSMVPSEYVEIGSRVTYDETLELLQNGEVLNELVDVNNQAKIVDFTWNTGQPLTYSSHYSLALEDGSTSFVSKTGALKVGEMYSVPTNFIISSDNPNGPENWLDDYWLLTTNNDSNAWGVDLDGVISGFISKSKTVAIQPAFVIDKEVTVISGEGTIESPYVI